MSLANIPTQGLTYTLEQLRAFLANISQAATPEAMLAVAPIANPSATFRIAVAVARPAVEAHIAEIEAELAERRAA
jgi:hypothetical protein